MAKEQYKYRNSRIETNQIIANIQQWVSQQGFSTKLSEEGGWTVIRITKGAALWKGKLSFYIQGNKEQFSVLVEKGGSGMAFLKGGLIGASLQKKVTRLAEGALSLISQSSGAQRIS